MALAERIEVLDQPKGHEGDGDVVLGDDWIAPGAGDASDARDASIGAPPVRSSGHSPLRRKIVTFNLIALTVLVAGILFLNTSRDALVAQRTIGLEVEARLIAGIFEVQMPVGGPVNLATGDGIDIDTTLAAVDLEAGTMAHVFDLDGAQLGNTRGEANGPIRTERPTPLMDLVTTVWTGISGTSLDPRTASPDTVAAAAKELVTQAAGGTAAAGVLNLSQRDSVLAVAVPLMRTGAPVGVVLLSSDATEIDAMVRVERERVLQIFVIATLVSIGLSLVLASTISNPLAELAAAAEIGRDRNARKLNPGRIRIPDLSGRPDEIGRLSGALRGMVAALYDRIDSNEQFAADVAREIKNPLASLRSAVGTLRFAKRDDQRDKLLDVIDHDVRRLDRLVSDISNASRLDSDLVKEEEENFNLLNMLGNVTQYLGEDARGKGIDFIVDLPVDAIHVHGLEARLAQVFVNLITNAISFCEDGDAIRVWARQRENRVLVVVEDTGPGIPDEALNKIFNRFYSQRPEDQFGNNSGLGLAISKQIVEAHGGVIWAENIRPTEVDITSEPLGARFVVGLPV